MKLSKNMIGMLTAIWSHTESKKADRYCSWHYGSWAGRTDDALRTRGLIMDNPDEHASSLELDDDGNYRRVYRDRDGNVVEGMRDRQSVVLTDAGRKALDDMAAAEGLTIDQWWCPARPDLWRDDSYTVADMERAWKVYDLRSYGEAHDRTEYIAECMAEKRA